ncbi:hypothetical protein BaRGS_00032117 [Batillaria attramentaria]|uniref:Beta-galactosidase n=1 Tax=Batillaria attramentaria TaxID=370345 RepID=A0ABD0JQ97_9CAEN
MRTFVLREKHKQRLYILIAAVVLLAWVYYRGIPGFGSGSSDSVKNSAAVGVDMMEKRTEGLTFAKRQFFLNGKPFRIISGAMHYFRVPVQYWKDRMLKMKACGLNTLETYVAWNMHEPVPGKFNFAGMLNLRKYLDLAHQMGLYVILRPGPYICSEWDFGGMPSWLLSDPSMKVRSNYKPYQDAAARFFANLIPLVTDLQFTRGGPIIAVQVENEFGAYSGEVDHLAFLKDLLRAHGITELLVTSDGAEGHVRAPFYKDALPTANFKEIESGQAIFEIIKQESPEFPLMVMEFWTGWFDHWGQPHNTDNLGDYADRVSKILETGASMNFYMFHGGTNFGFMAGANNFYHYKPDVTSYDYDAPLSEAGDITPKYLKTREIILEKVYKPLGITTLPDVPPNIPKAEYGKLRMTEFMLWRDLLSHVLVRKRAISENLHPMEMYKFDHGIGQSYGYIVYHKEIGNGNKLELPPRAHDSLQVLLNSWTCGTADSDTKKLEFDLHASQPKNDLDIIVENLGRVNFIKHDAHDPNILNTERKGLSGDVKLDGRFVTDWTALALDFDADFLLKVSKDSKWRSFEPQKNSPALYRAYLQISGTPQDTFVNTKEWRKGLVIVNGINLGRYWEKGPQKTLYLPAPFLRTGKNEILVYEEFASGENIYFDSEPQLG